MGFFFVVGTKMWKNRFAYEKTRKINKVYLVSIIVLATPIFLLIVVKAIIETNYYWVLLIYFFYYRWTLSAQKPPKG